MTSVRTTAAALTATLGVAAACWAVSVRQMTGMDMGVATRPGSLGFIAVVWVVFAAYRPHGTAVAGAVTVAAGAYKLTPLKARFRRRCRDSAGPGWGFGLCCLGSSAGLMAVLVVLGLMSVGWMVVITVVVTAQKLLPPRAVLDVPVALAIVALGS
jgi:predicted metal-binding membrane protein